MTVSNPFDITDRDEGILTDLYFCRILSTQQIAQRYFNTEATAKRKLHRLKEEKGILIPRTAQKGLTVWALNRRAFEREVETLRRGNEPYRDWPKPRAIPHLVDTNDIYIAIVDGMNRVLGELPKGWNWRNEAQAWTHYNHGGEHGLVHRPDAEIHFAGHIYFLERQTHRARKTREQIEEKLEGYRRYIRRLRSLDNKGEIEVLFACDEERDMDYALQAAKKYGLGMTAGDTDQITDHLLDKAEESLPAKSA